MQCAPSLVVIRPSTRPVRASSSSRLVVVVSGGRLARNAGRVVRVRRRRRQSRTRARCARGRVARRVVVNHRHIPMTVRASTNAPSLVVRCGLSASGARDDDDDDGDGPKWHIGRMSHRLTNSTPTAAPRAHTNRIMIFHHPSLGFPT